MSHEASHDGTVATVTALRAAGVSRATIDARSRHPERWQRLLPGVLLLSARPPTRPQLLRAALLYAGDGAVVTGVDAMRAAGADVRHCGWDRRVHVLVPAARRIGGYAFARVERTTRMPATARVDGMTFAHPARATVDATRACIEPNTITTLLTTALTTCACTFTELKAELDAGNQRGSAATRAALAELSRERTSPLLRLADRIVTAAGLPPAVWNVALHDGTRRSIGIVDAWWGRVGLAWDCGAQPTVPSESAKDARDRALVARGVLVLRTSPGRLRDDAAGLTLVLADAYAKAGDRRGALTNIRTGASPRCLEHDDGRR